MKASKLVMAFAVVAVLAMAFTSVGYAYTASTENSNNSVISQYVTLTQQNYTFSNTDLSFDVIDTEAATVYQLVGGCTPLIDFGNKVYYGVLIGEDRLEATITGAPDQVLGISVTSQNVGGSFTDFSGDPAGWRYVLKVTEDNGFILLHQGPNDDGKYTVVTVPAEGDPDVTRDKLVNSPVSLSGTWYDVNGKPHTDSYTVSADDADASGYILLYQESNATNTYTVVTVPAVGDPGVTRNLADGTGPVSLASGTWYDINGAEHTTSYTVNAGDAYSKEDQYAHYDGSDAGIWKMYERHIDTDYTITPGDPDAGGFICLHGYGSWTKYTVILVDGSGTNQDPYTVTYKSLSAGEQVSDVTGWFIDGREIRTDKYTVSPDDADTGGNIVIYKTGSTDGKFTVIKNSGSGVSLVAGKKDIGDTVTGVAGWHARAMKLNIETGTTYVTKLYLAGPGEDSGASIRSEGSLIKAPSQITIMPKWVPVTASEAADRTYVKYTLDSGDGQGDNRVVYVKSGSSVMLPENCFSPPAEHPDWVFVGWKADNLDKIFTSEHIYTNFTSERTFTAQWAAADNCWTVTFFPGVEGRGEMETRYILKNADSGNTFTLPPYKFTSPENKYTGWVVAGTSGRDYSEYNTYFIDIPAVKENLTVTAQWEEARVGAEDVTISFGSNTVIKVASNGTATVLASKYIGDTVTGVDGWYIKGAPISGDSYTLRESDVVHGGYIVIYETANAADKYSVILVEGNSAIVVEDQVSGNKINSVGGWMVNGSLVYDAPYYVNADDADDRGFIVVYDTTNAKGEYAVIKIPTTSGSPSITRGMHVNDTVDGVQNWYVNGTKIQSNSYTVSAGDAVNGYIILCQSDDDESRYNPAGTYTVIKASVGTVGVTSSLDPGDKISGVKGWNIKGMSVGTYTVNPDDASTIGGGYILLYDNAAGEYNMHTGENGSYRLPYCIMAAPENPGLINFKGWKLLGWEVISIPGASVPQSYTMPDGTDGYIVKKGTIKFTYRNDLRNGGAQE